jgi:hypothetical protein
MNADKTTRNAAYIGAGAGLALFAIIGLLPGSLIGGSMGINIAGALFGLPLKSHLLTRAIVALSMLTGVFIAGSVFVACGTMIGWAMGSVIDAVPLRAYFTGRGKAKKSPHDRAGQGGSDS